MRSMTITFQTLARPLTLFLCLMSIQNGAEAKPSKTVDSFHRKSEKYTITVVKSDIHTAVEKGMKLAYALRRNGKVVRPNDLRAGTLLGCGYPEILLKRIELADGPWGWMVATGGICGNTFSYKLHLVVVRPGEDEYDLTEIIAKNLPVLRKPGQKLQFWYQKQVWGTGGTAMSFFVPQLLEYDITYNTFDRPKLPSDFSLWPKLEFMSFPGMYVAGLEDSNAEVMKLAVEKFFDPVEAKKTYGAQGLPTTKQEAMVQVRAIQALTPLFDSVRSEIR